MKYEAEVKSAIKYAAPMELQNGLWVPSGVDNTIPVPEGAPHDYPIPYTSLDEIDKPYRIPASTPSDVKEIMAAYEELTGFVVDKAKLGSVLVHEAEHQEAIAWQHGSSIYGVVIMANWKARQLGWTLVCTPYGFTTTKIGHALTSVYPREPSPADYRKMRGLGYQSVREVGTIAAQYGLPMPLSIVPRSN